MPANDPAKNRRPLVLKIGRRIRMSLTYERLLLLTISFKSKRLSVAFHLKIKFLIFFLIYQTNAK